MPLNPMMSQAMHPQIQGGDDSTMIFIIVIMFCCSIFCAFIYFYIQQENAEEEEDACIQHTESVSCSADTSCSWNTDTFLCSKVGGGGGVTKCSVEEHVLSGECKPCPKFPNGSFSMKSPGEVVLKDADDTTCSVKQPCPENYHVSSGSCVACGSGLIRDAGDDPNLSDTECKRGKCRNNQRIECSDSCSEGTCCCVDCPSGKESSKIHAKSPDDISVSDPQCVEIGQGVSAQLQSPSASATPTLSRHRLCNINQRVNSEGLCEDCVEGETTNNTRHDPTLGETYCDKPNCTDNQYAIHTVPGGACGDCIGQETNDGGFSPTDITKGECLKCKNTSYLNENNECTLCPDDMVVNGRPFHVTEPGGESYFKTDLTMVGLDNCKKALCASNERISCVKDQDDIWSCSCTGCEVGKFSILPHTIHPDDYPPNIPIEVTDNYTSECVDFCGSARHTLIIDNWEKSVEQCEEKGLCTEANCELDEMTGLDLNDADPCSEMKIKELTTLIDDYLDTTGTSLSPQTKHPGLERCPNSPLNNRVQGLKGRLKSIRLSSPCPVNYRFNSESSEDLEDKCERCDGTNGTNGKIGSYPEGRVENFDPNHQHPRPRSVTTTSTICKEAPCKPGEEIYCSSPNCNENTQNPDMECRPCNEGLLTSGLPYGNNGNHQISISDAEYKDVTVCRDPNAIVATCGNVDGLGKTIADLAGGCGDDYSPVTGAGLETVCGGTSCDLTRDPVRSGDHKKCCVPNETCAGRKLYEGTVGDVTTGGVITINLPDETSSLSSSRIIGKKIKFTVPPPRDAGEGWTRSSCMAAISTAQRMRTPLLLGHGCSCSNSNDCLSGDCKDSGSSIYGGRNLTNSGDSGCKPRVLATPIKTNYTGSINNYEYLNGNHKISVTYGDDGSGIPSGIPNITFIILEELSSSCPTGTISNNNPDIHCIGASCDFRGLTDSGLCCEVPEDGYIVSLNQRCEFKGEADSTIRLAPVFDDNIDDGKAKCRAAYDWITTNKVGHTPMRDVILDGESPFIHEQGSGGLDNRSPPGCWWWDPHSGKGREGARVNHQNKLWYNTRERLGSNPDTSMKFKKAICKGPVPEVEKAYANQPVANPEENLFGTGGTATSPVGWRPMPLDGVHGEVRSSEANWQACQQRCLDTTGCIYFNSYSNGGCHITDGRNGFDKVSSNIPSKSGRARWALEKE